jgi:putative PIN family toxin of toxin-antitoxin system
VVRKKDCLPVVIDTNVFVANYLSTNPKSPNVTTVRLWRERKLQLIIFQEIAFEYAGVLAELNILENLVANFLTSLRESDIVTQINLGKRLVYSRDPKDNPFLSTASRNRAKYLIINDNDLLEIPKVTKRKYKFLIITAAEFLKAYFEQTKS